MRNNKKKIIGWTAAFLCAVLLASCGSTSTMAESSDESSSLNSMEGFVTRAEDFDIELLRDALSSQEAIFRFSGYQNYDYVLTQQNRQAITDVLNAYNLMCSVSPDVLRKALA